MVNSGPATPSVSCQPNGDAFASAGFATTVWPPSVGLSFGSSKTLYDDPSSTGSGVLSEAIAVAAPAEPGRAIAAAIAPALSCDTKSAVSSTAPVTASTLTLQRWSLPSAMSRFHARRSDPSAAGCHTSLAGIGVREMPPPVRTTSFSAPP
jgi:hypothetical protein